ncbi:MAG TPA: hypothetical protein VHY22_03670 [Chthoniobacteraceae bacterium]|jgi:hypothetical protein|nr:hypothetical protein [Chthoniobacteraceae bacterium]
MPTFQTQIIRIAADTTSKDNVLDLNTSAEPQAWWARDLCIQTGVFAGQTLLDVSDLQSVSVSLKDPSNLDGAPLVAKTITTFDNTTTAQTWAAGTQQHFIVSFTADDLSFSLTNGQRLVHLSMVAITTGGQTGTLCVGTINVIDDGGNSAASNPANAITVGQAQAMVAALAWVNGPLTLSAAGATDVKNTQTWLQGQAPVSVQAGSAAFVTNLTLDPANAIPGAVLQIPIDFAASQNGTLNIYDGTTGGTLLQTLQQPDATQTRSYLLLCRFDGAHWHKMGGFWT